MRRSNDPPSCSNGLPRLAGAIALCLLAILSRQSASAQSLLLPGGIVYDAVGNLYLAETANHIVRRLSPAGILTIVAGTGAQGFAGDGGPATAALLDSPAGLALDAAGGLYIADSHNQRIRRVDLVSGIIVTTAGNGGAGDGGDAGLATTARLNLPSGIALNATGDLFVADTRNHRVRRVDYATGVITTYAGTGLQGFSGDGGPASLALLDSPAGMALDASGNLFVADSHNQRIRRVDRASGIISTVGGGGVALFSGDGGQAVAAGLNLPRGIALDAAGNIYLADLRNQRVRRIDAATGIISTVAGQGAELFAGDGQLAVAASLDSPRAVALSPGGLVTLSDTANQRVRQVDAGGVIHTIAGGAGLVSTAVTLAGEAAILYGTGSVTATVTPAPASGAVTFSDVQAGAPSVLATVSLTNSQASLSTVALAAGAHQLSAVYNGDPAHAPAQSAALAVAVSPAPIMVSPVPWSLLYGQAVPAMTGAVTGVLAQDSGRLTAVFSTAARQFSGPGVYPITAALAGPAAGNYVPSITPASVMIGQAPAVVSLQTSSPSAPPGTLVTITAHVASSTAGTPIGGVTLADSGTLLGSAVPGAAGDAVFALSTLAAGAHTLTASYAGDANFLPAASAPLLQTIGVTASPDFSLAPMGVTSQTVLAGSSAVFAFSATPIVSQGTTLSSPILLAASGLPPGATASFSPAFLPPGDSTFTLTIQTPVALLHTGNSLTFVLLAPILFALSLTRRRRLFCLSFVCFVLVGCGARVATETQTAAISTSYAIQVTGTATSPTGTALVHSTGVTLIVTR